LQDVVPEPYFSRYGIFVFPLIPPPPVSPL